MIYIKEYIKQEKKYQMKSCGDTIVSFRYNNKSYFAIFDGVGSGVYANIVSNMMATQFKEKILRNFSFTKVCESLVDYIETTEPKEKLYCAFTAVYIYNNNAQLFVYDAPNPIIQRGGVASLLKLRSQSTEVANYRVGKSVLEENDRIMIFSDGLSESGSEIGISGGIGSKGILASYNSVRNKIDINGAMEHIYKHCKQISLGEYRDDSSMIVLEAERGKVLSLFTGPPSMMKDDALFACDFLSADGTKVICGSTTADIISRELGADLVRTHKGTGSMADPPMYTMDGVDLVSEGAVCLNQVYNLLESGETDFEDNTSPELLSNLLLSHDIIYFYIGRAENLAHKAIVFKQLGIEERNIIVSKLAKLLSSFGKTIVMKYY